MKQILQWRLRRKKQTNLLSLVLLFNKWRGDRGKITHTCNTVIEFLHQTFTAPSSGQYVHDKKPRSTMTSGSYEETKRKNSFKTDEVDLLQPSSQSHCCGSSFRCAEVKKCVETTERLHSVGNTLIEFSLPNKQTKRNNNSAYRHIIWIGLSFSKAQFGNSSWMFALNIKSKAEVITVKERRRTERSMVEVKQW